MKFHGFRRSLHSLSARMEGTNADLMLFNRTFFCYSLCSVSLSFRKETRAPAFARSSSHGIRRPKTDLLRELQLFQGIVERKNTIPILANVLLEADGDEVDCSRPTSRSDCAASAGPR